MCGVRWEAVLPATPHSKWRRVNGSHQRVAASREINHAIQRVAEKTTHQPCPPLECGGKGYSPPHRFGSTTTLRRPFNALPRKPPTSHALTAPASAAETSCMKGRAKAVWRGVPLPTALQTPPRQWLSSARRCIPGDQPRHSTRCRGNHPPAVRALECGGKGYSPPHRFGSTTTLRRPFNALPRKPPTSRAFTAPASAAETSCVKGRAKAVWRGVPLPTALQTAPRQWLSSARRCIPGDQPRHSTRCRENHQPAMRSPPRQAPRRLPA